MKEIAFKDREGQELIVKHRKSAVFFEGKVDISKPNSYGEKHSEYICIKELHKLYNFSKRILKNSYRIVKKLLMKVGLVSNLKLQIVLVLITMIIMIKSSTIMEVYLFEQELLV